MRLQPILYGIAGTLFIGSALTVGAFESDPGTTRLLYLLAAAGAVLGIWTETSGEGWIDARGIHLFNLEYLKISLSAVAEDLKTGKTVDGRELSQSEIEDRQREVRDLLAHLNRARNAGLVSDATYKKVETEYQSLCNG